MNQACVFSSSDIQEDSELVAKDDNLDAGKSNREKTQQDKKEEKEEAEADDDGQGQDKINEQIDEVMRIQNPPALLTQARATATHSSQGVSGRIFSHLSFVFPLPHKGMCHRAA